MEDQKGWRLQLDRCRVDFDFVDYLRSYGITNNLILYMGPGKHHHVGIQATKLGNYVLALTVSFEEDSIYDKMLEVRWLEEPRPPYNCLFLDIYDFDPVGLYSQFNIIGLPHLGEMLEREDPRPLATLTRLKRALVPNGRFFFYTGSSAWDRMSSLPAKVPGITLEGWHKSLEIWRKT